MELSQPKNGNSACHPTQRKLNDLDRLMAVTVDITPRRRYGLGEARPPKHPRPITCSGTFVRGVIRPLGADRGSARYCRWRGMEMAKLGDISQLAVWALLVIPAIAFLIPAAGRSPYPLVDNALAGLDARMHFQTVTVVHLFSHLPLLRRTLAIVYGLLPILILGSLLVPTICGRVIDSRRYIFAVIIAAVVTATLFAFWPAAGPWTVEGFAPTRAQAAVYDNLSLLKSSKPLPAEVGGAVVAFPSFHVVLAVLSIIAMWKVRWARWPALALGTLICVSTITTGWHYLIDLIGGLAVTYVAQRIANLVLESAPSPLASGLTSDEAETVPV